MEREEYLNRYVSDFQHMCCPFGSRDIKTAIEWVIESGLVYYDYQAPEKVIKLAEEFADGTDIKLREVDICYVVLSVIFREARREIEEKINVDIQNDYRFEIYSECMYNSFDYNSDDIKNLQDDIKKAGLTYEDFESETKFFFDKCGIILNFKLSNNK